jgi:hypothetical protein
VVPPHVELSSVERPSAEQLAVGQHVAELPVVEPLVVELPAGGLLVEELDVRPARLSFAALYSLAVAALRNQCWS